MKPYESWTMATSLIFALIGIGFAMLGVNGTSGPRSIATLCLTLSPLILIAAMTIAIVRK